MKCRTTTTDHRVEERFGWTYRKYHDFPHAISATVERWFVWIARNLIISELDPVVVLSKDTQ